MVEALRFGWITSEHGTKRLERRLAKYFPTSIIVCLNPSTASEELDFRICDVGKGNGDIIERNQEISLLKKSFVHFFTSQKLEKSEQSDKNARVQ